MEISSLSDLDFNESGEWPFVVKMIAIILLCAVVWGGVRGGCVVRGAWFVARGA